MRRRFDVKTKLKRITSREELPLGLSTPRKEMALLYCYSPLAAISSPSLSLWPPLAVAAASIARLPIKPISLHPSHFAPLSISKRGYPAIRAAANVDGVGPTADGAVPPPPENNQEVVPVDKLPLESKLQERMEQKMRMKMAKKIRLRRKRLVRKRHLRKKGRWRPSKMKKLKNV